MFLLGVVLFGGGAGLVAQTAPFDSFRDEVDFGEWVTYYYTNPQPGRLLVAIDYYAHSTLFANENGRIPLAQFAAEILRGDDAMTHALFEQAAEDGGEAYRAFALHVLWLVDTPATRELLDQAANSWGGGAAEVVAQMKSEPPVDLLKSGVSAATDLDRLWGLYLATGSEAPIEQVVSTLVWSEPTEDQLTIQRAAKWSLLSNALQHDPVREYIVRRSASAEAPLRAHLEEVLSELQAPVGP